jgi:hypothetical protein
MTTGYRPQLIALAALVLLSVGFASAETILDKPPGASGNAWFPHVADAWSPDARFLLKNVDTPDDPKTPHSIYLTDMKTGTRAVLYSYARRAEILWSPASDAVAINDWDANNDAQSMVFPLLPHQEHIDLREEFLKSRRPDREKKLAADHRTYDHNYAHVIRWLDGKTVLLMIEGHSSTARKRFRLEYTYRLGDSFRLRRRAMD